MKKLLLFLLPLAMVVSCSKDNETDNPLVGTTWEWENWLYSMINGGTWYQTIQFVDNNTYNHFYKKKIDGTTRDLSEGAQYIYDVSAKTVILYHKDGTEWNTFILVSDTKMHPITNENVIFEKQL